ncbi:hypothetical protein VDS33_19330, partial [Xanthomonas campestris pv. campestris]|nr:hypothetical protein [Xanthomonas campestris pv. campestris]
PQVGIDGQQRLARARVLIPINPIAHKCAPTKRKGMARDGLLPPQAGANMLVAVAKNPLAAAS